MSKEASKGKVVIEEDYNDNLATNKLDDIESKIVVEEGYYEEEEEEEEEDDDEETSNMSIDDGNCEDKGSYLDGQALDLSFLSSSIPLKKRKISSSVCLDEKQKLNDYQDKNMYCHLKDNLTNYNCFSSSFGLQLKQPLMAKNKSKSSVPLPLVKQEVNKSSSKLSSSGSGSIKGISCRRPGFITCSICNATKYYSHVQRRFGQYSCEPCSKFMKRFLRDPKIYTCSHEGHCKIGKPSGEQEPRGVSVNRCKACWLKICLEKFILDSGTRMVIDKYYAPKFYDNSSSHNSRSGSNKVDVNGSSLPPLPFPQRKRKPKSETISNSIQSEAVNPLPSRKDKKQLIKPIFSTEPLCLTTSKKLDGKEKDLLTNSLSSVSSSSSSSSSSSFSFIEQKKGSKDKDEQVNRDNVAIKCNSMDLSIISKSHHDINSREPDLNDLYVSDFSDKIDEKCGNCSYCLPSADERANVVVVNQACKYMTYHLNMIAKKNEEENQQEEEEEGGQDQEEEEGQDQEDDRNNNNNNNVNNKNSDQDVAVNQAKVVDRKSKEGIKVNSKESDKTILNKPLKKMIISDHFNHNRGKNDLTGSVISSVINSESKFLAEILNTNSPFL